MADEFKIDRPEILDSVFIRSSRRKVGVKLCRAWLHPVVENLYDGDATDVESSLVDVLTDLMHYCQSQAIDFNEVIVTAEMHFEAEKVDEPEDESDSTMESED